MEESKFATLMLSLRDAGAECNERQKHELMAEVQQLWGGEGRVVVVCVVCTVSTGWFRIH